MSASGVSLNAPLARSTRFVDAARALCDAGRALGLHGTCVYLHCASGRPGLGIDNFPDLTEQHRLFGVSEENWLNNPAFQLLRQRLGVLGEETLDAAAYLAIAREHGYTGASDHPMFTPLVGADGWFGTAIFGFTTSPSIELERQLLRLTTELSVWCTDHGIRRLPDDPMPPLAPRQHGVAKLAAAGRTNAEIAQELAISINTVKARLKEVFERLAVTNRTELANALRGVAPLLGIPEGVTHLDGVTITRPHPDG